MIDPLSTALTVFALVAAAYALVMVIANRPLILDQRLGIGMTLLLLLLELGLLAQAVVGVVQLVGTDRDLDSLSFLGYLLGALLVPPAAAFWSLAERSRWGAAVLMIGCLVVPVMIVRLDRLWSVPGV